MILTFHVVRFFEKHTFYIGPEVGADGRCVYINIWILPGQLLQ